MKRWLAMVAIALGGCDGCGDPPPEPRAEEPAPPSPPLPPPPPPPLEAPNEPLHLVPRRIRDAPFEDESSPTIHTVDDAVLVSLGRQLARWNADGSFSPLSRVPRHVLPGASGDVIGVVGHAPNRLDGVFLHWEPRVQSEQAFVAFPAKGRELPAVESSRILAVAHRGPTTLAVQWAADEGPARIVKAEGPGPVPVFATGTSVGCEAGKSAVQTYDFTASRAGTVAHLGRHCQTGGWTLEVWAPASERSKLVPLPSIDPNLAPTLLRGRGDRLVIAVRGAPHLRYEAGSLGAIPYPSETWFDTFVSPAGDLFVVGPHQIALLTDEGWVPWATVDASLDRLRGFAFHGGRIVADSFGGLVELVPEPTREIDRQDDCATPFVLLGAPTFDDHPHATHLQARFSASLEGPSRHRLVETMHEGIRYVGLTVDTMATAREVMDRAADSKDLHREPRLWCWAPTDVKPLSP